MQLRHFNAPNRKFRFKKVWAETTRNGNVILNFELWHPIPLVKGSMRHPETLEPYTAKNVRQLHISFSHAEEAAAKLNIYSKNKVLSVGPDVILDVARAGTVWVTSTSFAQNFSQLRSERLRARLTNILKDKKDKGESY